MVNSELNLGDKSAFVAIMDRVKLMNITGKALSGEWGNEDTTGEGTCVLRTANFTNEGVFNYDEVVTRKIPSKKGLENKYLRRGDIVIEKSGGSDKWPVGRVIYFNEEENKYLFNNFTGLLRVQDRKKWNPKYVFYSLYFNYLVGGTRQYENKTTGLHNLKTDLYVENFKVKSISKAEQDDIVTKIDNIRHIIDAKNKQILMFDELIKARFVEMFGEISTGNYKYNTKKLGDVAKVGSSHRVFTTEFVKNGIPFYRGTEIGELANGQIPEEPFCISEEHYERLVSDDTKPQVGDLLMPSICNKGQVWMVDTEEPFYYKDGRVLLISPNRDLFDCKYLECFMRAKTLMEYPKLGSGSTFAEFKIFLLKDIDVLIPPLEIQSQFADFVKQVDKSKFLSNHSLFLL